MDIPNPQNRDVVWEATLDNRYQIQVQRTDSHQGELIVYDPRTEKTLFQESTTLHYGARFGPDVADIQRWQQQALEVIDS